MIVHFFVIMHFVFLQNAKEQEGIFKSLRDRLNEFPDSRCKKDKGQDCLSFFIAKQNSRIVYGTVICISQINFIYFFNMNNIMLSYNPLKIIGSHQAIFRPSYELFSCVIGFYCNLLVKPGLMSDTILSDNIKQKKKNLFFSRSTANFCDLLKLKKFREILFENSAPSLFSLISQQCSLSSSRGSAKYHRKVRISTNRYEWGREMRNEWHFAYGGIMVMGSGWDTNSTAPNIEN